MKKKLDTKCALFPMPVLMIATYNEDGSIDVMNAAWGMMVDADTIALNLTETHKTVENIKMRNAFTVSLANAENVKIADYFGMISAKNEPNKFQNSGLTASKSDVIDAPIIEEFPITMECEFIEYQSNEYGVGVIGKIVNVTADEKILTNGKVDISKANIIAFDAFTNGYYKVTERVGNAFQDGLSLKNK